MIRSHECIRLLREQRGLSQNELARRCSWAQSAISRLESDKTYFTVDKLDVVLDAFGMTAASFWRARAAFGRARAA